MTWMTWPPSADLLNSADLLPDRTLALYHTRFGCGLACMVVVLIVLFVAFSRGELLSPEIAEGWHHHKQHEHEP